MTDLTAPGKHSILIVLRIGNEGTEYDAGLGKLGFISPHLIPRRAVWRRRASPGGNDGGRAEGGLTFQKGVGAVHALSHALGGLREPSLHHGTLNAILFPPVLRFNADHVGDKMKRLNAAMVLPASDSAWVAQQGGLQLNTVSTT